MRKLSIILLLSVLFIGTAAVSHGAASAHLLTEGALTPAAVPPALSASATEQKTLKVERMEKLDRTERAERTEKAKPEQRERRRVTPATATSSNEMTPSQIDSLVALWGEQQKLASYDNFFRDYIDLESYATFNTSSYTELSDSVYAQRLRDLVSPVQLPYNPIVKSYIARYVDTRYPTITRILSYSRYYFPMFEEELIKSGLPVELRALPIIESALSATAGSRMGAVGLWQFMPATGKSYGLEINSFVDERMDPLLSTRAACRFLKDLYRIYGDWTLAIAAYNCGPGNVNKAITRAGGTRGVSTFWDIYDQLPQETRGYIPAFIGASYAYTYHQQHGIKSDNPPMPLATDTIRVTRLLHLGQVAETLDVPIETLRTLNPQYKLDIIPATVKSYTLTLPQQYVCRYIESQDEIHRLDSTYLKEYIDPVNISKKIEADTIPSYGTHTVKSGDTLGALARRYKTTTANLMKLNKLKNANTLRIGQKLRVPR